MAHTIIRVRKADGEIKEIRREGHIIETERRQTIEASAEKMGAVVIQWRLIGAAPTQPVMSGRARARVNQYTSRPRFNSDNTERCKGCGRIGDDGECGLGHY